MPKSCPNITFPINKIFPDKERYEIFENLVEKIKIFVQDFVPIRTALRACTNDIPKIKIGKNQNQNWALIGQGPKTC